MSSVVATRVKGSVSFYILYFTCSASATDILSSKAVFYMSWEKPELSTRSMMRLWLGLKHKY